LNSLLFEEHRKPEFICRSALWNRLKKTPPDQVLRIFNFGIAFLSIFEALQNEKRANFAMALAKKIQFFGVQQLNASRTWQRIFP
jgi:hypothetical protein